MHYDYLFINDGVKAKMYLFQYIYLDLLFLDDPSSCLSLFHKHSGFLQFVQM